MERRRSLRLWILAPIAALAFAATSQALDHPGTSARFAWDAGEGCCEAEGYHVEVARDGGEWMRELSVTDMNAIILGIPGETIQVRVVAFRGETESSASVPSEEVRFIAVPTPTGVRVTCEDGSVPTIDATGLIICPQ